MAHRIEDFCGRSQHTRQSIDEQTHQFILLDERGEQAREFLQRAAISIPLPVEPLVHECLDAIAFDPSWNGACVLGRSDGALLGILLVDGDGARVAPLPGD